MIWARHHIQIFTKDELFTLCAKDLEHESQDYDFSEGQGFFFK